MRYNAFVSYSHAADGKLAPALQFALHHLAKPWYKIRALNVFRDQTNLAASPHLWSSIETALSASEYFILLASPRSAASVWVQKEINYWLANRTIDTFLIGLTEGNLQWSTENNDFDWTCTDAVSRSLQGKFSMEPLYVDLRDFHNANDLSLNNPAFKNQAIILASTLRNIAPGDLIGQDVEQHRKTIRTRNFVLTLLLMLLFGVVGFAWKSNENAKEAKKQAEIAGFNEKDANKQRDIAKNRGDSLLLQLKISDALRLSEQTQRELAVHNATLALKREKETRSNYYALQAQNALKYQKNPNLSAQYCIKALNENPGNEEAQRLLVESAFPPDILSDSNRLYTPDLVPLAGKFKAVTTDNRYVLTYDNRRDKTLIWNLEEQHLSGEAPGDFQHFTPNNAGVFITGDKNRNYYQATLNGNYKIEPLHKAEINRPIAASAPCTANLYAFRKSVDPLFGEKYTLTFDSFIGYENSEYLITKRFINDSVAFIESRITKMYEHDEVEAMFVNCLSDDTLFVGSPNAPSIDTRPEYQLVKFEKNAAFLQYREEIVYCDLIHFRAYSLPYLDTASLDAFLNGVQVYTYTDELSAAKYVNVYGDSITAFFNPHTCPGTIKDIVELNDRKIIISASDEKTYLWLDRRNAYEEYAGNFAFVHNKFPYLITEIDSGVYNVWKRKTKQPVAYIRGSLAKTDINQPFATIQTAGGFSVVDLRTGLIRDFNTSLEGCSFDGRFVFRANGEKVVRLDLLTNREIKLGRFIKASPDGRLVVGRNDKGLYAVNVENQSKKYYMPILTSISDIIISYDNCKALLLVYNQYELPELYYWDFIKGTIEQVEISFEDFRSFNEYDGNSEDIPIVLKNFSKDGKSAFLTVEQSTMHNDRGDNEYFNMYTFLFTVADGKVVSKCKVFDEAYYAYDEPDNIITPRFRDDCHYYHPYLNEYHKYPPSHPADDIFHWEIFPADGSSWLSAKAHSNARLEVRENTIEGYNSSNAKVFVLEHPDQRLRFSKAFQNGDYVIASTTNGKTIIWDMNILTLTDRYALPEN